MYSGYQMTSLEYQKSMVHSLGQLAAKGKWKFLKIANKLKDTADNAPILPILAAGGQKLFKVFSLNKGFRIGLYIFCALLLGLTIGLIITFADFLSNIEINIDVFDYLPALGFTVLIIIVTKAFGKKLADLIGWIKPEGKLQKKFIGIGIALFLWIISKIYLTFFNKRYLKDGEL